MVKEILSKTALLTLGIMALSLSLNPAHAMEDDERNAGSSLTVLPSQYEASASSHNITEFFPDEVQILIFQKLSIKDLGLCAPVCHKWNALSSHEDVWREMARNFEQEGRTFFIGDPLTPPSLQGIPSWKKIINNTILNEKEEKEEQKREEEEEREKRERFIKEFKCGNYSTYFKSYPLVRIETNLPSYLNPQKTFQEIEVAKIELQRKKKLSFKPFEFETFAPLDLERLYKPCKLEFVEIKRELPNFEYKTFNLESYLLKIAEKAVTPLQDKTEDAMDINTYQGL